MNFLYKKFIYYFLNYKNFNLNKKELEQITNKIIFHNNKIPDYLNFSIKIICSALVLIINILIFVCFYKLTTNIIFDYLLKKNVNLFFKIYKYHNGIYELIFNDNEKEKKNIALKSRKKYIFSNKIYDLIIVGSGPSGSIIANDIKNKLSFKILDAGKKINEDYYSYNEILNKYKNAGVNITFGNSQISFVESFCVGGGSEINSGLFHKLPKDILSYWKKNFKLIVHLDKYEIIYDDIIKKLSIKNYVNKSDIPKPSLILKKGANSIGYECKEIPRWVNYDHATKKYFKNSVINTYLKKDIIEKNLLENTKVIKLKQKKDYWRIFTKHNNKDEIFKAKKVILSSGAISTPQILLKSGIKKNIGNKFQMHPTIKVVALFDNKINHEGMGVASYQARSIKNNKIYFGSSISSISYLKIALDHIPKFDSIIDKQWENMAIFYIAISPEGTGKIRNLPFFKDPFITYNLTLNDRMNLALGLKDLCKMLLNANAKKIFPSIIGCKPISNYKELEKLPQTINSKKSNLFSVHIFSSCPIGENKEICAADSSGKVYGHKNLYVCDASTIPSATGVNPQGPLMYLTYNFLEHFKKKL